MSFLELATAGIPEAGAVLAHVEEGLADVEPVIEEIHRLFMDVEKQRFDAEGPGWAPLAPSTLAEKRRKGLSERILEATGAMRKSFTEADAPGHVFEVRVTPDLTTVTMGSDYKAPSQRGRWANTALAAFHQDGTSRMPARPVIDTETLDLDATMWAGILSGWLLGAVGV